MENYVAPVGRSHWPVISSRASGQLTLVSTVRVHLPNVSAPLRFGRIENLSFGSPTQIEVAPRAGSYLRKLVGISASGYPDASESLTLNCEQLSSVRR